MNKQIPIIIICGPTGSGKTAAAVNLALEHNIEIVSADSRQIYRRLNIGTAKPTPEERETVPFHLVDIVDPGEKYSAARFIDDAAAAIEEITGRGAAPVVVGGTGLYLRALSEGVVDIDEGDGSVRAALEQEIAAAGSQKMHEKLAQIDPQEAAKIHPNNKVRILRALEIFHLSGKTKTELMAAGSYKKCEWSFTFLNLCPERAALYERINARVDLMMQQGLLVEVENLVSEGLAEAIRRSNVIGYNEMLEFIDGRSSLEQAVALIKQNSRRYAKRQMTWFRHQVESRQFADSDRLIREIAGNMRGAGPPHPKKT